MFVCFSLVFGRYKSEAKVVKVGEKYALQANFTLTPEDSKVEEGKVPTINMADTNGPISKELKTLIKDLSAENGLEHFLLTSSADVPPHRYHLYKDMAMFLRGLNLNYPQITHLSR